MPDYDNEPVGMGCAKTPDPRDASDCDDDERTERILELWRDLEASLEDFDDDEIDEMKATLNKLHVVAWRQKNWDDAPDVEKVRELHKKIGAALKAFDALAKVMEG